ncbi:MAG: bifunctional WbnG and putative acetyltransferase [Bacteroidetes bacterium]|nr:MAG: bifunctional WbnG and putative acetyltransferase [Bacteroidota bacterium]
MIIVGAKGFAKEVLEVIHQLHSTDKIVFFDDISLDLPDMLYSKFQILKSLEEAKLFFKNENTSDFTLGLGTPILRKKMFEKFSSIGGVVKSTISPYARLGIHDVSLGKGLNIMTGSVITCSVDVGDFALINLNCTIGHDSTIGKFVEMSPGVHISGRCQIGDFVTIGTNATLLPDVIVGNNVIIGANSLVNKNVPDNSVVVGVPAKVIKQLPPLMI